MMYLWLKCIMLSPTYQFYLHNLAHIWLEYEVGPINLNWQFINHLHSRQIFSITTKSKHHLYPNLNFICLVFMQLNKCTAPFTKSFASFLRDECLPAGVFWCSSCVNDKKHTQRHQDKVSSAEQRLEWWRDRVISHVRASRDGHIHNWCKLHQGCYDASLAWLIYIFYQKSDNRFGLIKSNGISDK